MIAFCTNSYQDCPGGTQGSLGGRYDSAYVSDYVYVAANVSGASSEYGMYFTHDVDVTGYTQAAIHFDGFLENATNAISDGEWFRWVAPDGQIMGYGDMLDGSLRLRVYNAAGGNVTATAFVLNDSVLDTYDFLYEDNGTNCTLEMYENDVLVKTATVASSGAPIMPTTFAVGHNDMFVSTGNLAYSQIIMAYDETTVGMKLQKVVPSAAGTYAELSSTVTEITDTDQSTGWTTATGGLKQSYTHPTYTLPGGRTVHSVNASILLKTGESTEGPTTVRQFVRSGGDVERNSTQDLSPSKYQHGRYSDSFLTDPDTGAAWTAAGITNAEVGFEVKANSLAISNTVSVNLATATDADLTFDVTAYDRIVVRASNVTKSGTSAATWFAYNGGVKLNSVNSYYWMQGDEATDDNAQHSAGVLGAGMISGQGYSVLAEIWGFAGGTQCASLCTSAQTTGSTVQDVASQCRTERETSVDKIQVFEAAGFSAGIVYIDLIKDAASTTGEIDFALSSSPTDLTFVGKPDYILQTEWGTDTVGQSASMGMRLSDDAFVSIENGIYSYGDLDYQNSAWTTLGSSTTGQIVNVNTTNVRFQSMDISGFNGAFQTWQGVLGESSRAYSIIGVTALENALTGAQYTSTNLSFPVSTGSVYYTYGNWASSFEKTGTATAATEISINTTGYSELTLAMPSYTCASGTVDIQLDDGTGYDTTNANYRNAYWYEAGAAGNDVTTWPGGNISNAGTSNRLAGRIFGLNSIGPAMGRCYWLHSGLSTEVRVSLWAYEGNIVDDIVGVRILPSAGSITGDYSLQAAGYN